MIGGRFASVVVVPPQVAVVEAGRIDQRIVAYQGKAAVRRALPLSLTFDHRVVTGGEAARFLMALVGMLLNWFWRTFRARLARLGVSAKLLAWVKDQG